MFLNAYQAWVLYSFIRKQPVGPPLTVFLSVYFFFDTGIFLSAKFLPLISHEFSWYAAF